MSQIAIFIQNDDNADLFFSVTDEVAGVQVVFDQPLADGQSVGVSVEANGDGSGIISWSCRRSEDASITGSDSNIEVSSGETVDIDTFG